MEIRLPTQLIPTAIEKLESDLSTTQDADNVNVNFSYLTFSKPLGMLVTGSLIRRWINYRRERGLRTTKSGINAKINAHSYLMHLGFFDYIGMNDVGSKIGAARGNTRYLPIRKVVREDLEKSVEETGEQLIDAIIFLADGLANVLSGSDTGEIKKSFSYSIREIIRNALEHSGSDVCYICGQRWVNGHSEIAIVDEGSGVYETLSNVYDVDDSKMLLHALKPGVSRTTGMSEEDNIYNNSGFGLYVLSELGNSFGWFCLGSGTRKLTYQDNEYALIKSPFQGTFVGIHLNEHPKQFAGVLSDIISVGEEEAKIEGR
ncbi:MAG: ATP-binding protein, partial [Atribacterota bacterium]|nr:ATP-binding protein [Atribacterota bacterium]